MDPIEFFLAHFDLSPMGRTKFWNFFNTTQDQKLILKVKKKLPVFTGKYGDLPAFRDKFTGARQKLEIFYW